MKRTIITIHVLLLPLIHYHCDIDHNLEKSIVKLIEQTFDGYGTVALKGNGGFVTTPRGHTGSPSFIKYVDFNKRIIYANKKATLNAPLLFKLFQNIDCDYIIHRHTFECANTIGYEIAGTLQEANAIVDYMLKNNLKEINIEHHGFVKCLKFSDVNWNNYYAEFPNKYFGYPKEFDDMLQQYEGLV